MSQSIMALLAMIRGAAQNNRVNFLRRAAGDVIGGGDNVGICRFVGGQSSSVSSLLVIALMAFVVMWVWLFCVLDATRSFDLSRQNPKQGQIRRPIVEPRRN
jgi:hypothetical protein